MTSQTITSRNPEVKALPESSPSLTSQVSNSNEAPQAANATPSSPTAVSIEIPAGTVVTVQTIDSIDSGTNKVGDQFRASLAAPVTVGNQAVIQKGANALLQLEQVKSAGHFRGKSEVQVELISIDNQGNPVSVAANPHDASGASRGKESAEVVGGGAALGGVIGAIVGGRKGAVVGGVAGGGAGATVQVATKGKRVFIPSETKIVFELQRPVTISYVATHQ